MNNATFLEKLLDLSADQARGAEACLSGRQVEWVALGEVAEIKRGTSITKNKVTPGDIPVIAGGRKPAYFHNTSNRNGQTIVISGSGAYAGFVSFWEQPVFVSDAFTVKPYHELLTRYCYHWLQGMQQKLHEMQSGGGIPHVYPRDIAPLKIPIPCPDNPEESLAIQAEIVRILDTFTELTAELTAELISELTARKKQFNYYRDQLLTFEEGDIEWKTLGEVGEFVRGKRFVKADMISEGVPCIHYGEMYTHYGIWADKAKSCVTSELVKKNKLRTAEKGNVVMVAAGETIEDIGMGTAWLSDEGVVIHDACFTYRSGLNPKYVAYFTRTKFFQSQVRKSVSSGKISAINAKGLSKVTIPIPSIAEQARIVGILDKFDTLTHSISEGLPREIELRQKQYEYYRGLLLNFPIPEPETEGVA